MSTTEKYVHLIGVSPVVRLTYRLSIDSTYKNLPDTDLKNYLLIIQLFRNTEDRVCTDIFLADKNQWRRRAQRASKLIWEDDTMENTFDISLFSYLREEKSKNLVVSKIRIKTRLVIWIENVKIFSCVINIPCILQRKNYYTDIGSLKMVNSSVGPSGVLSKFQMVGAI